MKAKSFDFGLLSPLQVQALLFSSPSCLGLWLLAASFVLPHSHFPFPLHHALCSSPLPLLLEHERDSPKIVDGDIHGLESIENTPHIDI